MISPYEPQDFEMIFEIINDSAKAYRGVIPADMYQEPYMSEKELKIQMQDGVQFWCYREDGNITGVMGIQFKGVVTLIRHAYVRTSSRGRGVGVKLLNHLLLKTSTPVLIGTWADADWAIRFYQKNGFRLLPMGEKDLLLGRFWKVSRRQTETSVVLADAAWK